MVRTKHPGIQNSIISLARTGERRQSLIQKSQTQQEGQKRLFSMFTAPKNHEISLNLN